MNKSSLVLKYFQKAESLSTKNPNYCHTISSLFLWLIRNDQVKNDLTSKFFFQRKTLASSGKIISHDNIITAGLDEIAFLLNKYTQLSIAAHIKDGQRAKKEEILAEISGKTYEILAYERTVLNILQRLSGIATETNRIIESLKTPQGWPAYKDSPGVEEPKIPHPFIAATRKTPWGLLDKKAVAVGGGLTHRLSLADGILIKDNHLAAIKKEYKLKTNEEAIVKAIEEAMKTPRGWPRLAGTPPMVKEAEKQLIEIEIETQNQAYAVVKTFNRLSNNRYHLTLMFDNFSPPRIKKTISLISPIAPITPIIFEASGGITKKNLLSFAQTEVDIISLGSLTHSPQAANLSLEISEEI